MTGDERPTRFARYVVFVVDIFGSVSDVLGRALMGQTGLIKSHGLSHKIMRTTDIWRLACQFFTTLVTRGFGRHICLTLSSSEGNRRMDLTQPTATQVGRLYDETTDLLVAAMGGNIHLGYWESEGDSSPLELAGDRLTDMVGPRLELGFGQRVLDVGCGTGRPAVRISTEHGVQVVGITVSARQVKLAQDASQAGSSEFVLADAMSTLPFPDSSFDAAYAIESLLHMSDQRAALTQVSRVLRPKGRLVIADACVRGTPDDHARSVMTQMGVQFQFASLLTRKEYQQLLGDAGFIVDDYTDIGENVRRSYAATAERVRHVAGSLDGQQAADLTATAQLLEEFGALPEIGYVLITAIHDQ